jgi:tetratricopeptide (TPR) repeat protein
LKEASIFIGERKLLELNNGVPVTTFDHYLRDFAVENLLSTSSWDDFRSYEFQMAESRRFWFEPVVQVAGMQLFSVHATHTTPKEEWLQTKRMQFDTLTGNGLLRKARGELLRRQYTAAIASLQKAQELAPAQAMIAYQLTVALAMGGRVEEAATQLQRLFSFAQSSTYTPVATKHLAVAQAKQQADRSANPMQRSLVLYDVATFYWNFGYYSEAYALLRDVLKRDSTYFTGLLWGWHYATQLGDSGQAREYLRQLEAIDRANRVVREFRTVTLLSDSLRRASSPVRRSELRLSIARAYESVDLPEEAIDEAQRATREFPSSSEAWLFQARLFEKRNAARAKRHAYQRVLAIDPTNETAVSKLKTD